MMFFDGVLPTVELTSELESVLGSWVAQLVERLTPDFGSFINSQRPGMEPHIVLSAQGGVCCSFSSDPPPACACFLSQIYT